MKLIPNVITSKVGRQALIVSKHSPTLLFASGVVGVTVSTVLACRATLKLEEVLHEAQSDLSVAHSIDNEKYSEEDRKKDIAIIYGRSGITVAKLYAPAVVVGLASVGALTASHRILTQRNVALTAAYAAIDEAFQQYRARVIEKYGEDEDRQLRFESEVVEVENEKGKLIKQLQIAPGADSMYARWFDSESAEWNPGAEYNYTFLRIQQNHWNDMLRARGHVFLNEVYKSLGLSHTRAGSIVGWINGDGDNYIDFGIFRDTENTRDFINGREGSILLDFNVDGIIYDKLGDK